MSKDMKQDVPGVIIFPPIIIISTLVFGFALQQLLPLDNLFRIGWELRWVLGFGLAVVGPLVMISAIKAMTRVGTNVNPSSPTTALVTDGVFRFSRNPIYLGGNLLIIGLAFIFATDWLLILFVPSQLILHWGVVLPEQRYLCRKFGDAYQIYKSETPQYIWPV
jgi:protein-S-isoprenylcysteine O-methyltransferase Ste14